MKPIKLIEWIILFLFIVVIILLLQVGSQLHREGSICVLNPIEYHQNKSGMSCYCVNYDAFGLSDKHRKY